MTQHPDALFFGRLAASMTHDMKNVLAIIGEKLGLLEDILDMVDDMPHKEKILGSVETMQQQIKRGMAQTSRLNTFAHSADEDRKEVDLNEAIPLILGLSERFARLRNIKIIQEPAESETRGMVDAFGLHMLLFTVLSVLLDVMPSDSSITVGWNSDADVIFSTDAISPEEVDENTISTAAWGMNVRAKLGAAQPATVTLLNVFGG